MASTLGRKVTIIRLHSTTRMSGFGEIKGNLTIAEEKKDLGILSAVVSDKGVLFTFKEKRTGKTYELEIPDANIISRELAPIEANNKA